MKGMHIQKILYWLCWPILLAVVIFALFKLL